MDRLDKMDKLVEKLGAAEALEALTSAMNEEEFQKKYDLVMKFYGLCEEEEKNDN